MRDQMPDDPVEQMALVAAAQTKRADVAFEVAQRVMEKAEPVFQKHDREGLLGDLRRWRHQLKLLDQLAADVADDPNLDPKAQKILKRMLRVVDRREEL